MNAPASNRAEWMAFAKFLMGVDVVIGGLLLLASLFMGAHP